MNKPLAWSEDGETRAERIAAIYRQPMSIDGHWVTKIEMVGDNGIVYTHHPECPLCLNLAPA